MLERDYLRRGAAEFVGTFALLFIAAGGAAYARNPTDLALANGLVIAVMVSAVGHISGGHFNPAVTLGFLVTRRLAPMLGLTYWAAQFGAAALAALLLRAIYPQAVRNVAHLGAPGLGGGVTPWQGFVIEVVLTFFL